MPSLVVIKLQIKEKQSGEHNGSSLMVPKDPSLNRIKLHYSRSRQKWSKNPVMVDCNLGPAKFQS